MDIEAIVKKHFDRWVTDTEFGNVEAHMRDALTELAAGYEKKIAGLESEAILSRALSDRIRQLEVEHDRKQALLLEAHCERVSSLQERIRQLEAELAKSREQAKRMLDAIYKLHPLASRVLWLAFVWNDQNFTHPLDHAREEAKKAGFNCLEDAQEFLADVAMRAAALAKERSDGH